MISAVICLPFWDRLFCLFAAYFAWMCHQVNIRAYYKKMYGRVSDCVNDTCMWLGIISVFSLPLIGFFDEHNYGYIHNPLAVVFFSATGLYAWIMAYSMAKNADKFPAEDLPTIKMITFLARIMFLSLLTLGISAN